MVVHQPGMGHGKNKVAQAARSAADSVQSRKNGEEHFLHDRLRIFHSAGLEIAQDLGRIGPVHEAEKLWIPGARPQSIISQRIGHGRRAFGEGTLLAQSRATDAVAECPCPANFTCGNQAARATASVPASKPFNL